MCCSILLALPEKDCHHSCLGGPVPALGAIPKGVPIGSVPGVGPVLGAVPGLGSPPGLLTMRTLRRNMLYFNQKISNNITGDRKR